MVGRYSRVGRDCRACVSANDQGDRRGARSRQGARTRKLYLNALAVRLGTHESGHVARRSMQDGTSFGDRDRFILRPLRAAPLSQWMASTGP